MGHGVPMARVRGAERFDAWRARWHHASLKTSFMVNMLGFLLLGENLTWGKVGCMALIGVGT